MLNPEGVGATTPPVRVEWSSDACLLYALGVGAGAEDPAFTTENTAGVRQRVLPTLPVVYGAGTEHFAYIGEFDWSRVVHARQGLELHRPLEVGGSASVTTTVVELLDKGTAAIMRTETVGRDPTSGDRLFTTRSEVYLGGAGGWGGERGYREPAPPRPGAPAHTVVYRTLADQALLYRLSGDRHRLHSDPGFAAEAGFRRPILHGLCTYGFAGRALLNVLAEDDPARLRTMDARFTAPVDPGEDLHVEIWPLGRGVASFQVKTGAGVVVLGDGSCRVSSD